MMGSLPTLGGDIAPLPHSDVLLSVRTGKIRPMAGVKLRSAIHKHPRQGRVALTSIGLAGDEQQYINHGGPDKALHQYDASHYAWWNQIVPNREGLFKIGGFGENLSTRMLNEGNVCIGDKFAIGSEVIVQVSEPRQPCRKLNHRFEWKKTSITAQTTGRTGWYLRILQMGAIQEGDEMRLIERPNPQWSIANVQKYLYHDTKNAEKIAEIAALPELGEEVVHLLEKRLVNGVEDMSGRLNGSGGPPIAWRTYRVVEKTRLTPRVRGFVLEVDNSSADMEQMSFGRFPHVRLQFGPDSSFTRTYSVVSGNSDRFELGIARDDNSRGGSTFLHDHLNVQDTIRIAKGHEVRTPSTTDCTGPSGKIRHIYIVGGIGVTAFLRDIASQSRLGANVEVHYAVRSRSEAAYLDQLPAKHTTVYAKDENRRLDLHQVIPSGDEACQTYVYCCGPSSLLSACRDLTLTLKYPRSRTHFEEFGGAASGTGDPFEVEIKESGKVIAVPRDKSLLDVLNESGFEVESSCLVGNCGTCTVDYCKGEVLHQGYALDEDQKSSSMLSCVSRGIGRIVVDVD